MTDQRRILYAGDEIDRISPDSIEERLDGLRVEHHDDFVKSLESAREDSVGGIVAVHRDGGFRGIDLLESVRREGLGIPVAVVVRDDEVGEVARRAVEADATALVPAGDEDAVEAICEEIERNMSIRDGREGDSRMPISDLPFEDERRLKERVLDEAPIGITVSNADKPDNPIIYLNKSFERLTGYSAEEVVGANHRFLQGRKTDSDKVEELGKGISEGRETRVRLRNYTRDGDLFWNQVDVSPISDSEGELSYYVGFQMDITERERFRHELKEEREAFDRLIDRMNSLINDITRRLVGAEGRGEIEEAVVERLGNEYGEAWMGRYSPADDCVTVEESSVRTEKEGQRCIGVEGGDPEASLMADVVGRHETAVIEGNESEYLRRSILGESGQREDETEASSFCITVPVTYQSTTYGVVGVWGDGNLDSREPMLLSSVARSVGASINDVLTKRTMSTDSVIRMGLRIEGSSSPLGDVADKVNGSLEHEAAVAQGGSLAILVSTSADPEETAEAARATEGVIDAEVLVSDEEGSVVQIRVDGLSLVGEVSEHGGRLRSMEVTQDGVKAELDVGNEREARRLLDSLRQTYSDGGTGVSLVTYRTVEEASQTTHGFRDEVRDRLTQRQITALQKAYAGGFFDWPRRVEGETLAESMDIVPSTYHQHLRTAERKLIEVFLNS